MCGQVFLEEKAAIRIGRERAQRGDDIIERTLEERGGACRISSESSAPRPVSVPSRRQSRRLRLMRRLHIARRCRGSGQAQAGSGAKSPDSQRRARPE